MFAGVLFAADIIGTGTESSKEEALKNARLDCQSQISINISAVTVAESHDDDSSRSASMSQYSYQYTTFETAVLTLKIVDETEGILYTYSKEYVVEPTQNRDFLTLSDIQAATNGNTKLGALANTNVYLDASLEAISVEDRSTTRGAKPRGL